MKLEELDVILQKLEQLCEDIEEDGRSIESIERAMEDEHFYNLLTSSFVDIAPSMERHGSRSMCELSNELAKVIYMDKYSCDSLIDYICDEVKILLNRVEDCRYTNNHNVRELEIFVHFGKVLDYWAEGNGICDKCGNMGKANIAKLACYVTRIKKPFIAASFPVQDNSKGIVNSEDTYYSDEQKYKGEQLRLRIEFAELIIELVKSQKLVE